MTKEELMRAKGLVDKFSIQTHGIIFNSPIYGINPHEAVETIRRLIDNALEPDAGVEAALEDLMILSHKCSFCDFDENEHNRAYNNVSQALQRPAMVDEGWFPIETCPYAKSVLIARDHGNPGVTSAYRCDKDLFLAGLTPYKDPTHWRPLPAAPSKDV